MATYNMLDHYTRQGLPGFPSTRSYSLGWHYSYHIVQITLS